MCGSDGARRAPPLASHSCSARGPGQTPVRPPVACDGPCFGSRRFQGSREVVRIFGEGKMQFSPISGPRIRIRDFSEKDLPEFARYRALPEVARYQSWEHYSLEDAQRLYAAQQATAFGSESSWHQLAIADQTSDALTGDCATH